MEDEYFQNIDTIPKLINIIIRNIEKLFQSRPKNLDAKLWIQKAILKKYLKNN